MSVEPVTYMGVVKFPHWPNRTMDLVVQNLVGGALSIQLIPGLRLGVSVTRKDFSHEASIASLETCPLQGVAASFHQLTVLWDGKFLDVSVDGNLAGSTNPEKKLPEIIHLRAASKGLSEKPKEDFLRQNINIRLRRRDSAAGIQPSRPGQRLKSKNEDFQELADEAKTLRDLIELVHRGKLYHAKGIARSLRKLLEPLERRMGVLQRCAGRIGESLIVYTLDNPSLAVPGSEDPEIHLVTDMRAHAADVFRNPVDVDVWLEFRGGRFRGKNYTHAGIIRAIGNTEAAHGDPTLSPVVEVLEKFQTEMTTGSPTDFVVSYIMEVGREIMLIAEDLIAKNTATG